MEQHQCKSPKVHVNISISKTQQNDSCNNNNNEMKTNDDS